MTTRLSDYPTTRLPPLADRITIEAVLYTGVFGVALFLRLFRLGLAPLSENEAAQAVAALRGVAMPAGGSPVLYAINSFVFMLLSSGDALVRMVPALAGAGLVLTPALFRDALGRFGALGASLILALSPVALVASRSLDGETIAVVCVLIAIALARRYPATQDARNLIGAAIVVGVGLASGSGIYTALLALGASWIVLRFALREDSSPSLSIPNGPRLVLVLAAAFAVTATGALTNPAGLGAAGDLLSAWLRGFGAPGGSSAFDILQVLIVYELFAVAVGVIGLARALARADRFGAWLGFAAIISLSIVVLQSARQPIDLLLPVTLLALLAAHAIQPWAEAVRSRASLAADGAILALGGVMAAFVILTLIAFVRGRMPASPLGLTTLSPYLVLLGIVIALPAVVAALLATVYDPPTFRRASATLGLALLTLGSIAAGWGATQARVGDPLEIILGPNVTATDVRALTEMADQLAVRTQGHSSTLPIRVEVEDPVLAWYFRDANPPPAQPAPGIVTLFGVPPKAPEVAYIGARFTTRQAWDTRGLDPDTWLEWAFFRTSRADVPLTVQAVTLWQKR